MAAGFVVVFDADFAALASALGSAFLAAVVVFFAAVLVFFAAVVVFFDALLVRVVVDVFLERDDCVVVSLSGASLASAAELLGFLRVSATFFLR